MKNLFLFSILIFSTSLFAAEPLPPALRPLGNYIFKGAYTVPQLRQAIAIQSKDSHSADLLKEYKAKGFSCLKSSLDSYLCSKMTKNPQVPAEVAAAIVKGLSKVTLRFPGPQSTPALAFDGSQTEWPIRIKGAPCSSFMGPMLISRKFVVGTGRSNSTMAKSEYCSASSLLS